MNYEQSTGASGTTYHPANKRAISRHRQLNSIYYNHLAELHGVTEDTFPAIRAEDAQNVMRDLQAAIPEYGGRPARFIQFARKFVRQRAKRYQLSADAPDALERIQFVEEVLRDPAYIAALLRGIRSALRGFIEDASVTEDDLLSEVLYVVWLFARDLSIPSPRAKLTTRLYGLGRRHALDYHVKPLRRAHRQFMKSLEAGVPFGVEVMTPEELAAERAAEADERVH